MWNKSIEKEFFIKALSFATTEKLFYKDDENKYFAYWKNNYKGKKYTLQSRNSLIGDYTEKWVVDFVSKAIKSNSLFAYQKILCEDLGLTEKSPADVVITDKSPNEIKKSKNGKIILKSNDVKLIIEVKMSIVWNWQLIEENNNIILKKLIISKPKE